MVEARDDLLGAKMWTNADLLRERKTEYARGVEDAAKVCDEYAKLAGEHLATFEKYCAATGCAERIRSLIPPTNVKGGE